MKVFTFLGGAPGLGVQLRDDRTGQWVPVGGAVQLHPKRAGIICEMYPDAIKPQDTPAQSPAQEPTPVALGDEVPVETAQEPPRVDEAPQLHPALSRALGLTAPAAKRVASALCYEGVRTAVEVRKWFGDLPANRMDELTRAMDDDEADGADVES